MINLEKQGSEIWFEFYRALPSTSIDFLYAYWEYQEYPKYEVVHDLTRSNIEVAFNNASPELRKYLTKSLSKYGNPIGVLSNIRKGEIAMFFGAGGGTQIQLGSNLKYYKAMNLLKGG